MYWALDLPTSTRTQKDTAKLTRYAHAFGRTSTYYELSNYLLEPKSEFIDTLVLELFVNI